MLHSSSRSISRLQTTRIWAKAFASGIAFSVQIKRSRRVMNAGISRVIKYEISAAA
jgi:hypothetical protein